MRAHTWQLTHHEQDVGTTWLELVPRYLVEGGTLETTLRSAFAIPNLLKALVEFRQHVSNIANTCMDTLEADIFRPCTRRHTLVHLGLETQLPAVQAVTMTIEQHSLLLQSKVLWNVHKLSRRLRRHMREHSKVIVNNAWLGRRTRIKRDTASDRTHLAQQLSRPASSAKSDNIEPLNTISCPKVPSHPGHAQSHVQLPT